MDSGFITKGWKGKFDWPKEGTGTAEISIRELRWLLDGLSLEQRSAHKK